MPRSLAWLSVLLLAGGCATTFHTTEVTRPITVDSALSEPSEISYLEEQLLSSLPDRSDWYATTRHAIRVIDVYNYDGFRYQLFELARALDQVPGDAYGWVYFGVYLMLQRQTEAGIDAIEEGVKVLDGKPRALAGSGALRQLRTVALLNIGLGHLSLERMDLSLGALARIERPEELDNFRRVAYLWIAAQANSGLKRSEAALRALAESQAVPLGKKPEELRASWDYPQYFVGGGKGPNRTASELFLAGMLALDAGSIEPAKAKFEGALRVHPDMLEAQFGLAKALIAGREFDAARTRLETMARQVPPGGYLRKEAVYFTLGNLEYTAGRYDAASVAYGEAIGEALARYDRYANDSSWKYFTPAGTAGQILVRTRDRARRGFPEAENNLASLFLERIERGDSMPPGTLAKAEEYLRKNLGNPAYRTPEIAHLNLARVSRAREDWEGMVYQATRALQVNPQYQPPIDLLLDAASKNPDLERAAGAYVVAFDAIARNPQLGHGEEQRKKLTAARQRLEAGPEGFDQARALGRLYLVTQEWSKGLQLLDKAFQLYPRALATAVGRARVEMANGNLTSAERWLDGALLEPKDAGPAADIDRRDALYFRSIIRAEKRQLEAAEADLDQARAIWPGWTPPGTRAKQ